MAKPAGPIIGSLSTANKRHPQSKSPPGGASRGSKMQVAAQVFYNKRFPAPAVGGGLTGSHFRGAREPGRARMNRGEGRARRGLAGREERVEEWLRGD